MKLIIVTGLSGSGKSIALRTLEDLGYYCIDNLPISLLGELTRLLLENPEQRYQRTAIGIDARNQRADLEQLIELVSHLRKQKIECEIIFLEAQNETLIKRYSETRRRHPLSQNGKPLKEAIHIERQLMEPFQLNADLRIDTTHTTQHQLRDAIRSRINADQKQTISIQFQSFGYKHGVPRDSDFVFDLRCLPNPHWHQKLRPFTGRDEKVAAFLSKKPLVQAYQQVVTDFLEQWVPHFEEDGRSYLTIAFGCTGGQHRSVYFAELFAKQFQELGYQSTCQHREFS